MNVIQSARYNPPCEAIKMRQFEFWDIKGPTDLFVEPSKFQNSKASTLLNESGNPSKRKHFFLKLSYRWKPMS